ncbi:thioesterase II family protein [Pseudoalteromonas piscicida]|uniref:Thioesterase n=1 Tax=Pseudoalteromonas piscicida TaxID=43662 RepID=A0AAD0W3N1_PSEO7|nr:alpha/beta fold hydrolase [Pseudoalteromonas piscicida]ASD67567.1 thioesterase [Pseudoalteromonas piscicida]AXQ98543.1 thioesterase [Pseudoalteromonas piscicida]AXR01731.1 thioesterase [Pseudoalteromonas piscicida]
MMQVDLYCFHHAGGSSLFFREWTKHLPAHWQLHGIDLPGRGTKAGMQSLRDWDEALSHLSSSTQLQPRSERLCVFFGHSLGGMVAYKLADHLAKHALTTPDLLCLSGCRAPSVPSATQYSRLTESDLLTTLYHLDMLPKHRLTKDVEAVVAAMFKDDFMLAEQPVSTDITLTMPVELILATEDHLVTPESHQAWSEYCENHFQYHHVDGGHMYLQQRPTLACEVIVAAVARHLARLQQTKYQKANWQKPLC